MRDALIALFKGHFEDDLLVGGNVTGKRWYEGEDGVRRKVDIVVHAWGSTYALDVAVVDPAAPTYIRMGSAAKLGVAARHRGEQKIACWRDHNDPDLIEDDMKEQVQLLNTMFQVPCDSVSDSE